MRVPVIIVMNMPMDYLDYEIKRLNRSRRRFVVWGLNGDRAFLRRRESISLLRVAKIARSRGGEI